MPQFEHHYYPTPLDTDPPIVGTCECCGMPIYQNEECWKSRNGWLFCEDCIHSHTANKDDAKEEPAQQITAERIRHV